MYDCLYQEIYNTDAEYIKGKGVAFFDEKFFKHYDDLTACPDWSVKNKVVINPKRYPWIFMTDNFIWNGIYRKEYLQQFPFSETSGAAFQDIGVLFKVILNSHETIYLNKPVYYYRRGDVFASSYNHKSLHYVLYEYEHLESFLDSLSEGWKYIYYCKLAGNLLDRFHFMVAENVFWSEVEEIISWFHEKLDYAVNNKILCKANFEATEWEEVQIFLKEGAHALFAFCQSELQSRAAVTLKTIETFKGHNWIIFGSSKIGLNIAYILRIHNIKVDALCDNSAKKQGQIIEGLKVLSPSEAVQTYPDSHFMIAGRRYFNDMRNQLLDLGVDATAIHKRIWPDELYTDFFTLLLLHRNLPIDISPRLKVGDS